MRKNQNRAKILAKSVNSQNFQNFRQNSQNSQNFQNFRQNRNIFISPFRNLDTTVFNDNRNIFISPLRNLDTTIFTDNPNITIPNFTEFPIDTNLFNLLIRSPTLRQNENIFIVNTPTITNNYSEDDPFGELEVVTPVPSSHNLYVSNTTRNRILRVMEENQFLLSNTRIDTFISANLNYALVNENSIREHQRANLSFDEIDVVRVRDLISYFTDSNQSNFVNQLLSMIYNLVNSLIRIHSNSQGAAFALNVDITFMIEGNIPHHARSSINFEGVNVDFRLISEKLVSDLINCTPYGLENKIVTSSNLDWNNDNNFKVINAKAYLSLLNDTASFYGWCFEPLTKSAIGVDWTPEDTSMFCFGECLFFGICKYHFNIPNIFDEKYRYQNNYASSINAVIDCDNNKLVNLMMHYNYRKSETSNFSAFYIDQCSAIQSIFNSLIDVQINVFDYFSLRWVDSGYIYGDKTFKGEKKCQLVYYCNHCFVVNDNYSDKELKEVYIKSSTYIPGELSDTTFNYKNMSLNEFFSKSCPFTNYKVDEKEVLPETLEEPLSDIKFVALLGEGDKLIENIIGCKIEDWDEKNNPDMNKLLNEIRNILYRAGQVYNKAQIIEFINKKQFKYFEEFIDQKKLEPFFKYVSYSMDLTNLKNVYETVHENKHYTMIDYDSETVSEISGETYVNMHQFAAFDITIDNNKVNYVQHECSKCKENSFSHQVIDPVKKYNLVNKNMIKVEILRYMPFIKENDKIIPSPITMLKSRDGIATMLNIIMNTAIKIGNTTTIIYAHNGANFDFNLLFNLDFNSSIFADPVGNILDCKLSKLGGAGEDLPEIVINYNNKKYTIYFRDSYRSMIDKSLSEACEKISSDYKKKDAFAKDAKSSEDVLKREEFKRLYNICFKNKENPNLFDFAEAYFLNEVNNDHKIEKAKLYEIYLEYSVYDIISLKEVINDILSRNLKLIGKTCANFVSRAQLSTKILKRCMNNSTIFNSMCFDMIMRRFSQGGRVYASSLGYIDNLPEDKEERRKYLLTLFKSKRYFVYNDVSSLYPAAIAFVRMPERLIKYDSINYNNVYNFFINRDKEIRKLISEEKWDECELFLTKMARWNNVFYLKYDVIDEGDGYCNVCPRKGLIKELTGGSIEMNINSTFDQVDGGNNIITSHITYFTKLVYNRAQIETPDRENIVCFTTTDKYAKYITSLYKIREEAKNSGDKDTDAFIKIILNSIYGKLLQKPCNDILADERTSNCILLGKHQYSGSFINHYVEISQPESKAHIGMYVLEASKFYVNRILNCIGGEPCGIYEGNRAWVLGDTDSFFTRKGETDEAIKYLNKFALDLKNPFVAIPTIENALGSIHGDKEIKGFDKANTIVYGILPVASKTYAVGLIAIDFEKDIIETAIKATAKGIPAKQQKEYSKTLDSFIDITDVQENNIRTNIEDHISFNRRMPGLTRIIQNRRMPMINAFFDSKNIDPTELTEEIMNKARRRFIRKPGYYQTCQIIFPKGSEKNPYDNIGLKL